MKSPSLRARVTLWYVSLLAAALVSFSGILYFGLQRYLDNALRHGIQLESQNIARNFVSQVDTKGNEWLVSELSESYAPDSRDHVVSVIRLRPGGAREVLYQFGLTREINRLSRDSLESQSSKSEYFRAENLPGLGPFTFYTLRYRTPTGALYEVESGVSHTPVDRILRSLLLALLMLTPLILVCATLGGYLLMSRPLSPLIALAEQAESIGVGKTIERLSVIATGDEFEALSISLNRMLDRLDHALEHNRRFSADVSHELRTPLTILGGELEQLLQSVPLDSDLSESVCSALEEIGRMSKIVEHLLAISVLESGQRVARDLVSLDRLTLRTAEEMRLLAVEKDIQVMCSANMQVMVFGDEIRLKQIVVNLLDNAIKYTAPGKKVFLSVFLHGGKAILEVRDEGIGISPDALPHIKERFYRANRARSRDMSGGGLGLSICEAICRAHSGELHITSQESVGTIAWLELPHAKTDSVAENSPDSMIAPHA